MDSAGFAEFVLARERATGRKQIDVARAAARLSGADGEQFHTEVQRYQRLISRIEKGEQTKLPPADEVHILAKALDTTVRQLTTAAGYKDDEETAPDIDQGETNFWGAIRGDVPARDYELLKAFAETVRRKAREGQN